MNLLDPAAIPFSAALLLMLMLVIAEVIGALTGFLPSAMLDNALPDVELDTDYDSPAGGPLDADGPQLGDTPGGLSRFFGWLSVGKVPILVLIIAFLASFGLGGLMLQVASNGIIGITLPVIASVPAAFLIALYPTRWLGRGVAAIFPKEHTEASSADDFIGRIAVITSGIARKGLAAEGKLKDSFGQTHYVRIEPDGEETFEHGAEVLLTTRAGGVYYAILNTSLHLTDKGESNGQ